MDEKVVASHFTATSAAALRADHCAAPTITLATHLSMLGKPSTAIPNGFDEASRAMSEEARKLRPNDGLIRIGHASGSLTHQRDLREASPALARVLHEQDDARLVLFRGMVDVSEFPELADLAERIDGERRFRCQNCRWSTHDSISTSRPSKWATSTARPRVR